MGKTLLIVEDNEPDIVTYQRILEKSRLNFDQVDVCRSLAEAEDYFESKVPDCCLVDHRLPDGCSDQLLPKLTKGSGLLICPVVVITGEGDETISAKFIQSGVQSYLVKSQFNASGFVDALESALSSYQVQIS